MTPTPTPTPDLEDDLSLYWLGTEPMGAKLEDEIIPEFTGEYDVNVDIGYSTGYRSRVFPYLDSLLEDGDPPDLYFDELAYLGTYLAREQLEPLDHVLEDLTAANGDLVVRSPVQVQGTTYLVPNDVVLGGVFQYRADIYDELGLSIPETWDELLENTRAIDETEQFETRGFAVGASEYDKADGDFTNWFYNAGGQYFRWADEDRTEVELEFQTDRVRAALGLMQELAQYSPDPGEQSVAKVMTKWIDGVIAQCLSRGTYLAGIADYHEKERIALNTRQTLVPRRNRSVDPIDRGWATVRGSVSFVGANHNVAAEFLRFVYEGPERQAGMNLVEYPMYGLPPYREVLETERYRSADLFQAHDGHFLDLQRHVMDEIAPRLAGDRPRTPAAIYALQGDAIIEMVHAVVAEGNPIGDEIDRARNRLQRRLEEGREPGSG